VPDRKCVELKSLKLYIGSFRNEGAFHEAVTNRICDDLVKLLSPRFLRLIARFFVRGGISPAWWPNIARKAGDPPPAWSLHRSTSRRARAKGSNVNPRLQSLQPYRSRNCAVCRGREAEPRARAHQSGHRRAAAPDPELIKRALSENLAKLAAYPPRPAAIRCARRSSSGWGVAIPCAPSIGKPRYYP